MTQHYTIADDGSTVNVWDHNGTQIATDRPVDGPGVPDFIGGQFPDEVRQALMEEVQTNAQQGNTQYALTVLADVVAFDVTEGAP